MANCLKTQLKGVVNNNELLPLNAIRLSFKQNQFNNTKSQGFTVRFSGDGPVMATLVGDGELQTTLGQPTGQKTLPLTSGVPMYVSNNDCYVDITPYNAIWAVELGGSGDGEFRQKGIVNVESLKYLPITRLELSETNIPLKLEYLTQNELEYMMLKYGGSFTGDLSVLEGKTIGVFYITDCQTITGSLDSFLNVTKLSNGALDVRYTPQIYKKRSTVTALQNAGWELFITPEEIDENA